MVQARTVIQQINKHYPIKQINMIKLCESTTPVYLISIYMKNINNYILISHFRRLDQGCQKTSKSLNFGLYFTTE